MPRVGNTAYGMASEGPLPHDDLSTSTSTSSSRATSDTDINRLSSKATYNLPLRSPYAPSTIATGPQPSPIPLTFRPEFRHAATLTNPLEALLEHDHPLLDMMADTSSRHANNRALELGQRSSPPKPSTWHESVHRDQLVRVWDTVCDVTSRNPNYPKCITSQLGSTLHAMVKRCPELAQGKVPLTQDWIEYVLGKALRPPFCTAANMSRWEILASSGGTRSMWGPW